MVAELNAVITEKLELTPELFILRIKPDFGVPDFLPGQYVAIGLPDSAPRPAGFPLDREATTSGKIIKRAYSIGSSPTQKNYIEFYIAVVPDGSLTPRLLLPKPGDRIFMANKVTGTFTLSAVPESANLVLVSTGTGLAPYMAMLRTPNTWTVGRNITVIHGVRYPKDLAYRDELQHFVEKQGLIYIPVVSRGGEQWSGEKGHVQQLFDTGKLVLSTSKDHVYLCGNPAMVEGMEKLLLAKGFVEHSRKQPGNMHLEKYW